MKHVVKMQVLQERQVQSQQVQFREARRAQQILDGFLLLHSCRVKLPHEAIRSKLSSENIVDAREEDLVYFKNLVSLDLSDNSLCLEALTNLAAIEELDLQYNNLDHLEVQRDCFQQLHTLRLSYNKIPASHLSELASLPNLRVLELGSNDFCTLPSDLSFLHSLEELDLSANNFSSESVLVNPGKLMAAVASVPNLRILSLARNKLKCFHSDELPESAFQYLEELNFSFNLVEAEEDLMSCATSMPSLKVLIVTGNPFAMKGDEGVFELAAEMMRRGGRVVNDNMNPATWMRRTRSKK